MSESETKPAAASKAVAAALPVLGRHVNTARTQTETAVRTLNKHFMALMQQLHEMSSLAAAIHEGGAAAFDRIDEAFMAMSEAQLALATQQAQLARRSETLAPQISALLARSRELASRDRASSELLEQIESVATQTFEVIDAQERLSESTLAASQHAETRVDAVLAPYGESLSKLAQYGDGMRAEVGECLVHLQFQDRISQILGHVTASLEQLTRYLHRPGALSGRDQSILDELTEGYTMEEQHQDHRDVIAAQSVADE